MQKYPIMAYMLAIANFHFFKFYIRMRKKHENNSCNEKDKDENLFKIILAIFLQEKKNTIVFHLVQL